MESAFALADHLNKSGRKLVLAESCTCGMAAAMIGRVGGASSFFCGSSVTYREATKCSWLKIDPEILASFTAESQQTTSQMAANILGLTPEADFAAAITGHFGPGAPDPLDGIVHMAILQRGAQVVKLESITLEQTNRVDRQIEAADRFLAWIGQHVQTC